MRIVRLEAIALIVTLPAMAGGDYRG